MELFFQQLQSLIIYRTPNVNRQSSCSSNGKVFQLTFGKISKLGKGWGQHFIFSGQRGNPQYLEVVFTSLQFRFTLLLLRLYYYYCQNLLSLKNILIPFFKLSQIFYVIDLKNQCDKKITKTKKRQQKTNLTTITSTTKNISRK